MRREIAQVIRKDQVMDLMYGNISHPKEILGRHMVRGGQVISAYHPDAVSMCLIDESGEAHTMDPVERQAIYATFVAKEEEFSYKIAMTFRDGNSFITEDPYSYGSQITKEEEEKFLQGTWSEAYMKLGAHPMTIGGVSGVYFAVWAPNARRVSVVGDFNYWNGMLAPMQRLDDSGIYEVFLPGIKARALYKYEIKTRDGDIIRKVDPFGSIDLIGKDASFVMDAQSYQWDDENWMKERALKGWRSTPFAVCDREFLDTFAEEFKESECFTHVLLKTPTFCHGMNGHVSEWINRLHNQNMGVILEISMGEFEQDTPELRHFDGTPLYGNSGMRIYHESGKEMYCFDHEKKEVVSYLLSYLTYWIRFYHVDGFLFKGVSDMLYPVNIRQKDAHGKPMVVYQKATEQFLCDAVSLIKKEDSSILVFSDETREMTNHNDNLMFHKANFDALINYSIVRNLGEYLLTSIDNPSIDYYKVGLPMMKNGIRKTIINVSIDKSVHFDKQFMEESFLNEFDHLSWKKLTMGYLTGVPGRKRWSWQEMESAPIHNYMKQLFQLYMEHKCMYKREPRRSSFIWINGLDAKNAVLTFMRRAPECNSNLLFVCNFSREKKEGFHVGAPKLGQYRLILNSDWEEFGGTVRNNGDNTMYATEKEWDLQPYSIRITIPALSVLVFEF